MIVNVEVFINISEKHTAENKFRVSEEMLSLSILLYSGIDKIRQPGFYVSQYKLDEIESIPYINELFSAVENLYVLVSKCESENGEINYEKYLTWDRIKI